MVTLALERFRARAARLYLAEPPQRPTIVSVGRELGRSRHAVWRALVALGVPRRPRGGSSRRALPGCPVCGRMRALRVRFRDAILRPEYYCRFCQARSGARWRDRNPERFAAAPSRVRRARVFAQLRRAG